MCSFGYVLCNSDFSVIETNDFLMNPDAPFDWYLFAKSSKCHLAHSREEYHRQPKFPHFYSKLCALLAAQNRLVFGFGCRSDAVTVVSECMRYGLEPPAFDCHDLLPMLEAKYETHGRLSNFVDILGIGTFGKEFHDSKNDALFTMKLAQRLSMDSGREIPELVSAFSPYKTAQISEEVRKKLFKQWLKKRYQKEEIRKVGKVPEWFDFQKELKILAKEEGKAAR